MSSQEQNLSPVELVLQNGDIHATKRMLDYRWNHGWRLDRIIDHNNLIRPILLIYYFVRQ
jgi:hypothetical protein